MNDLTAAVSLSAQRNRLRRAVGLSFGVAVIVGGTVGAGILRTPGTVASYLGRGDLILAAWLIVGVIVALGANCYAELATAMPSAGGPFVFVRRAFGEAAGFVAASSDWLTQLCALAYVSVALGEYCIGLIPALGGREHLVAIAFLSAVTALNWLGLRAGARFQQWMSAAKALGFVALAIACLVSGAQPLGNVLGSPHAPSMTFMACIAAMVLAVRTVSETYSGWNGIVYFSEDQREPSTNIPRSLFLGVVAVIVLYLLINIGLLRTLSLEAMASSQLAVADAARILFGDLGGRLVTVFAVISLLGILNVIAMGAPRILFGLGRDSFASARMSRLNRSGAPGVAMLLTSSAAAVLISLSSFDLLFSIAAFLGLAVDASVYLSLFRLRHTEPNLTRPYRARGYPVFPAIALLVSTLLLGALVFDDVKTSVYAIVLLSLAYVICAAIRRCHG